MRRDVVIRCRTMVWLPLPTILAGLLGVCTAMAVGPEPVSFSVTPMTFNVKVSDEAARGSATKGSGYYPIKGTMRTEARTVDVVRLDNGLVEAWIVPAWAGRLLRAFDKRTGVDYFRWGGDVDGQLAWSFPGGVKPSFPFFEHGTHLEQPAGWRIVTHADASVTVAMDLRFTQYVTPADSGRYGRYGDEALDIMVTVRPGSSVVYWRQRKENPNPLPRAERMWNDTLYPVTRVKKADGSEDRDAMKKLTRFLFPARYVTDHGPTTVHSSPHWSCPDNWDISHFAIDAPYHFVGVYDVSSRVNRLRINDERGPAAKMYTCFWGDFCEQWGGVGYVFEKPGRLLPAYQPVEFTHRFWVAQGIGEVAFANDEVAIAVTGERFELVASREADVSVTDGSGTSVAEGYVGPHVVLSGRFDGRLLQVTEAGRILVKQSFPLDRPVPAKDEAIPADVKQTFDTIVASAGPEGETVAHNEGTSGAVDGIAVNPRVAYRFGQFEKALALLGDSGDSDACLLRGLIAWERGGAVDFGNAGWSADYHRALQAIQRKDTGEALKRVASYIEHVPEAWYPRLARAYWSGDTATARALASENPASPEAQLVLKLLGERNELGLLLKNNPHADLHVASFEAQLTHGLWRHLPRYPVREGIHP